MNIIEFLAKKGILKEGRTKFVIKFDDGREFEVGYLMEEFAVIKLRELTEKIEESQMYGFEDILDEYLEKNIINTQTLKNATKNTP